MMPALSTATFRPAARLSELVDKEAPALASGIEDFTAALNLRPLKARGDAATARPVPA